jgi:hypothetical protein
VGLKNTLVFLFGIFGLGCGGGTAGREDVVRPPNGRYCSSLVAGGTGLVNDPNHPNFVYLCDPALPGGAPCDWQGVWNAGNCRDFVAESNGYYAQYARDNRVPKYCWNSNYDPCQHWADGEGPSDCAFRAACVPIPNPDAGARRWMCPPEPCNL